MSHPALRIMRHAYGKETHVLSHRLFRFLQWFEVNITVRLGSFQLCIFTCDKGFISYSVSRKSTLSTRFTANLEVETRNEAGSVIKVNTTV